MIDGLVIKGVASRYKVDTADGIVTSYARGKLKIDGEIRVGDKVGVEKQGKDFVIAKVYERKNALIRPYVANVDVCFIVIAPVPAPDFMLVDKIIVNARMNGIEPVLLINKTDIADESFVKCAESDYRDVLDVIATSAKTKLNKDKIFEKTKGKTACLAGQSAVGKSSLLNMLTGTESQETGENTPRGSRKYLSSAARESSTRADFRCWNFPKISARRNLYIITTSLRRMPESADSAPAALT